MPKQNLRKVRDHAVRPAAGHRSAYETEDAAIRSAAPKLGIVRDSQAGTLFVMHDTRWDHPLKVTGDSDGPVCTLI